MRSDGTVIPKEISGLCFKQQKLLETSVLQAHWAGLFPNNKPDQEGIPDSQEYEPNLNRYFTGPRDMSKFEGKDVGASFFVVRRYHEY